MTLLVLILSLIAAQSGVSASIEEKLANEKVIVCPPSPILNQSRFESESEIEVPYSDPVPLWSDDNIVIDSAYDYEAISVATRRSTGEIYVAASRCLSAGETYKLRIWHSPDGINWSTLAGIGFSSGDLFNPSLNIFTTADSEYMIMPYGQFDTTTYEHNVRAYRRAIGATTGRFIDISVNANLSEMDPDICNSDLQFPNDPWLFCTFESGDSIAFVRSLDYGLTWTSRQIIGSGGATWDYQDPDCAFGWHSSPDSMFLGVAWQYTNIDGTREIRFRKNTINGTSGHWRPIDYFIAPPNKFDDYPALQMTHGNYPSALIMFVRKDTVGTDNADLYRYVTNNGAETWDTATQYNSAYAGNMPFGLGIDDDPGYYHLVFRDPVGSLRYQKSRYDSLWSAWSSYTYVCGSSSWSDYDFPAIGVRNNQPYICWVDGNAPVFKLKFDAEWLPAPIKEQKSSLPMRQMTLSPNPSSGKMEISYQLKQLGDIKISIYNASGRLIDNLVYPASTTGENNISLDYRHLSAGIYFVSVAMPDGISRQRVTIVK